MTKSFGIGVAVVSFGRWGSCTSPSSSAEKDSSESCGRSVTKPATFLVTVLLGPPTDFKVPVCTSYGEAVASRSNVLDVLVPVCTSYGEGMAPRSDVLDVLVPVGISDGGAMAPPSDVLDVLVLVCTSYGEIVAPRSKVLGVLVLVCT